MRTLLRFLVVAMMLPVIGCSKEFNAITEIENVSTTEANQSFYVTVDEAVATAKQFLGAGDTRSRDLRLKNHTLYKALSGTRSEENPVDVAFHVINFEDNQGYAIVSADSRATDVYAFSPTGNIDIDEAMENPGFQIFMNGAIANYEEEVDGFGNPYRDSMILFPYVPPGSGGGTTPGGGGSGNVTEYMITYLDGVGYYTNSSGWITEETIGPLLSTAWHQDPPYNYYCPTEDGELCVAGCVPVAISQIMAYHKYPSVVNGYSIDWYLAVLENVEEQLHYAARVIREVGRTAMSNYGVDNTSTLTTQARPTFRTFGYDAGYLESYDEDKVFTSIIDSLPVYTRGDDVVNGGGHAWIIDGYYKSRNTSYYYNMQSPYSLHTTIIEQKTYVHCNWGWGANQNCYCLEDTFVIYGDRMREEYDYENVKIIPNIHY